GGWRIRPRISSLVASSILPLASARPVECSMCSRARATPLSSASTPMTDSPLRANTSAMPAPMVPSPTTPTDANSRATACLHCSGYSCVSSRRGSGDATAQRPSSPPGKFTEHGLGRLLRLQARVQRVAFPTEVGELDLDRFTVPRGRSGELLVLPLDLAAFHVRGVVTLDRPHRTGQLHALGLAALQRWIRDPETDLDLPLVQVLAACRAVVQQRGVGLVALTEH